MKASADDSLAALASGDQCEITLDDGTVISGTFTHRKTFGNSKGSMTQFCMTSKEHGELSIPLRAIASWRINGVKP